MYELTNMIGLFIVIRNVSRTHSASIYKYTIDGGTYIYYTYKVYYIFDRGTFQIDTNCVYNLSVCSVLLENFIRSSNN